MKVTPLLCFLLFFQTSFSQYNWITLDNELAAKQTLLGNNAVTMIWKGDSVIYKKEMGDFNAKTQAPIASCSKWLTAALVMQFVDEGKLSLDDKVMKYIPGFDLYFKDYITIRQCLSHMTGITDDEKFLKKMLERRKFTSLEEEVDEFMKREIRAKAGTDFWYGNIGLNIAGRVLEIISRKKFDILIRTKLLLPLGMTKTNFTAAPGQAVNPSGGAKSTAEDYMKFLVMMLNKGKINGQQVLSEKSVNEMLKIQDTKDQVKFAPKSAEGYLYASGSWVVEADKQMKQATALASPGLFGTWPMIDYCRGYAYIVFVKNLLGEERADVHRDLKKIIDKQIISTCR
jgi:CubicO group peptidase (beta-lactamase class C family)